LSKRIILADECFKLINTPYRAGGHTQYGVDCVGLLVLALMNGGICPLPLKKIVCEGYSQIATNTLLLKQIRNYCDRVENAEKGDILLFKIKDVPNPTHLAVMYDNNRIIHADSRAKRVVLVNYPSKEEGHKMSFFRIRE